MTVDPNRNDIVNNYDSELEKSFPIVEISKVSEQESWRKEVNRPIYHIHKWWATRLGSVFRGMVLSALKKPNYDVWSNFYKLHDLKDKIVLDPFMGSGTTLGEAAKLGAKTIGNDINPISSFQVRQAFSQVSESELIAEYSILESKVSQEIKQYYQTKDPITGHLIPVLYFFWTKLITLPDGEEIPLFSKYVFSQDAYPKKKPKAQIICPHCWHVIEDRYDATSLHCNKCDNIFNPQNGPANGQTVTAKDGRKYKIKELLSASKKAPMHKLYAMMAIDHTGKKIYLPINEDDLLLYKSAQDRLKKENLPLPCLAVRSGHNTDQARGYNYNQWRDFFNDRQLLCLGLLLKNILEITNTAIQEQFLCLFSSTLEFNNMFCSFKGEGTGAVRHMFSNHIIKPERTPLENSIWGSNKSSGTFDSLFNSRLLRAKKYLKEPFEVSLNFTETGEKSGSSKIICSNPLDVKVVHNFDDLQKQNHSMMILNGDSSSLPIPANSIDAVITDPPYFDFVHYSELSDFFFAWLSPVLSERYPEFTKNNSSDEGEVQQKDPLKFSKQLSLVFKECHRVLKDTGVLAFSFHHSRAEGWAAIYHAITNAGFAVVAVHPVHAEQRGASPKTATKEPISLDAILVCKKLSVTQKNITDPLFIKSRIEVQISELESAGMLISLSDKFVIKAAYALVEKSFEKLSYEQIKSYIETVSE